MRRRLRHTIVRWPVQRQVLQLLRAWSSSTKSAGGRTSQHSMMWVACTKLKRRPPGVRSCFVAGHACGIISRPLGSPSHCIVCLCHLSIPHGRPIRSPTCASEGGTSASTERVSQGARSMRSALYVGNAEHRIDVSVEWKHVEVATVPTRAHK